MCWPMIQAGNIVSRYITRKPLYSWTRKFFQLFKGSKETMFQDIMPFCPIRKQKCLEHKNTRCVLMNQIKSQYYPASCNSSQPDVSQKQQIDIIIPFAHYSLVHSGALSQNTKISCYHDCNPVERSTMYSLCDTGTCPSQVMWCLFNKVRNRNLLFYFCLTVVLQFAHIGHNSVSLKSTHPSSPDTDSNVF